MRTYVALLLLAFTSPVLYSQESKPLSIPGIILADLTTTFHDGIAYVTSPLRIDITDVEHLTLVAGSTAVLIGGDKSMMNAVHDIERTQTLNSIMDLGSAYADPRYAMIIPSTLYVVGLVSGQDGIRKTGRQVFQALLYSGIVTQSLKCIVGRGRPHVAGDPYTAKPFSFRDDHFSMPSGHATVSFAVSTVLARNIDNMYASIALYGLATTTAISRLYLDRHWLSDVFVGAVIGTATGFFVTRRDEVQTSGERTSPIRIMPTFTGVQFEYRF